MNNGEDWKEGTSELAEQTIGYSFRNKELLKRCFTHKSYANVTGTEHNERLEFLGDAVLELAVTERLYSENGGDEGTLTALRKKYVSKNALTAAAERAGIMRFLRFSGGEHNVGGKTSSNLFEAVVGGIYLDGGMEPAKAFIFRYVSELDLEDYKTVLQEYVQERVKATPVYRVYELPQGGFECTVSALGRSAKGRGAGKQTAETHAARELFRMLTEEKH